MIHFCLCTISILITIIIHSLTHSQPNLPDLDSATRIELMKKYRSTPTRTSSKRASDPYSEAVSLARRLFMLDGFKKSEVASKLADP